MIPKKNYKKFLIPGISDFIILIIFFSTIVFQLPKFADDPGVGWHLATGDYILKNKVIPHEDLFLGTPEKFPWISDQWLGDIIGSLMQRYLGWVGIYTLSTIFFIAIFFLFLYQAVIKETKLPLITLISIILAFKVSQIHFIFRPVLAGIFFFYLSYIHILKLRKIPENKSFYFCSLSLILIFILWSNIHPTFILGILLLILLIISELAESFVFTTNKTNSNVSKWKEYIIITLLCILATTINPYGFNLHKSIIELGNSDYFMSLNEEWLSPNFKDFEGKLILFVLFVYISGIFLSNKLGKFANSELFYFLTFLVFFYLSLNSIRFLPYFGAVFVIPFSFSLLNICQFIQEKFLQKVTRVCISSKIFRSKYNKW